jgi:hypothetical protein
MARKHYKAEEIVAKLRQVDVLTPQGQSMADAIRHGGGRSPEIRPVKGGRWLPDVPAW